jgi:hypothetical protein
MPTSAKTKLRHALQGLPKVMFLIGGISFFVGGRALRQFKNLDFVLAEVLGIGFAALCIGAGLIAKSKAGDVEWEEANENAAKINSCSPDQRRP